MNSNFHRNLIFETIDEISRLTALPHVSATFAGAVAKLGFDSFGINALPPPGDGADPVILTERTPDGFRGCYVEDRFYLVDHICAHARASHEPFRYSEAPYAWARASDHRRFMQALNTYHLGNGLVIPIGRPANIPACVWVAGKNPDLDDDATRAIQLIALFAAGKAHALSHPPNACAQTIKLTPREREVLQWVSAGKTSWEIAAIAGLSERAINKIVAEAMIKLDAVTRTQAVVNAIRIGEIEL